MINFLKSKLKFLIPIPIILLIIFCGYTFYVNSYPTLKIDTIVNENVDEEVFTILNYEHYPIGIYDFENKTYLLDSTSSKYTTTAYSKKSNALVPLDTILKNFALPLKYSSVEEMEETIGNIVEYKDYAYAEVLIFDDVSPKEFTLFYKIDKSLKTLKLPALSDKSSYVGINKFENHLYVLRDLGERYSLININLDTHSCTIGDVNYKKNDSAVIETFMVKNDTVYLGQRLNSTSIITSYNIKTNEVKEFNFNEGLYLYKLIRYNDNIIALLASDSDNDIFTKIKYVEFDENLNEVKTKFIEGLPDNLSTYSHSDNSIIHNSMLYTVISSKENNYENYMLKYDLEKDKIMYLSKLKSSASNKMLDHWDFLATIDDDLYNLD